MQVEQGRFCRVHHLQIFRHSTEGHVEVRGFEKTAFCQQQPHLGKTQRLQLNIEMNPAVESLRMKHLADEKLRDASTKDEVNGKPGDAGVPDEFLK